MTEMLPEQASFLHDAYVHSVNLTIDSEGNRLLAIRVHCHPDCGLADWDDQKLNVEFVDPLVIHGELLGHMANAEEINALDFTATEKMLSSIKYLTDAGIAPPTVVASVVFHSGSQLDIACKEIHVSVLA